MIDLSENETPLKDPPPERQEPEYPWEHLRKEIQWCAIDENGADFGYENKPYTHICAWAGGWEIFSLTDFDFPRGNLPWRETLRKRPEGV